VSATAPWCQDLETTPCRRSSKATLNVSESDLISAYQQAEGIWQTYVSVFVSVLFAYFVVAYLVGAKLSRWQVSIITGLYAVFALTILSLLVVTFGRMIDFGTDIQAINPEHIYFASAQQGNGAFGFGSLMLWSPFIGAFVAGLVFMFQIRRKAKIRETIQSSE
jgi:Kef-type K+ transport system membrane component KefB